MLGMTNTSYEPAADHGFWFEPAELEPTSARDRGGVWRAVADRTAALRPNEPLHGCSGRRSTRPLSDIGSHAAAGDDTPANMNGGAGSPGASDVLFANLETIVPSVVR